MDNNIVLRIKEFMEYKSLNSLTLSKELGYKSSEKLSRLFRDGNAKPSYDIIYDITNIFEINAEWLITGRGNMLREKEEQKPTISSPSVNMDNASPTIPPIGKMPDTPEAIPFAEATRNGLAPIPLVTQKAAAGFGSADFTIQKEDVKDYYVIPKFKHCHVDFMIEVTGLSMYPHYNSGDVIACSIIHNSQFIQWNKCHVIATTEQGILIKRLMPGDEKGYLKAVSDNKDYPPFDIPVNEITGIALVVGFVGLE
jgi:hypothetical protein bfra3_16308|nr:MAG TPA: hypothetical protein [Caudoviricetes sp.]